MQRVGELTWKETWLGLSFLGVLLAILLGLVVRRVSFSRTESGWGSRPAGSTALAPFKRQPRPVASRIVPSAERSTPEGGGGSSEWVEAVALPLEPAVERSVESAAWSRDAEPADDSLETPSRDESPAALPYAASYLPRDMGSVQAGDAAVPGDDEDCLGEPSEVGQRVEPPGQYTMALGDTIQSATQRVYGDQVHWRAIAAVNRHRHPHVEQLAPGDILVMPPLSQLRKDYPRYCPSESTGKPGDASAEDILPASPEAPR